MKEKFFDSRIGSLINSHSEVIFYLFWGVVTTIINWTTYSVCVQFFHTSISTANIIGWVLAILVAYVSNKIWVFKSRSWAPASVFREFGIFLSARVFTGIIEVVVCFRQDAAVKDVAAAFVFIVGSQDQPGFGDLFYCKDGCTAHRNVLLTIFFFVYASPRQEVSAFTRNR